MFLFIFNINESAGDITVTEVVRFIFYDRECFIPFGKGISD